MVVENNVRGCGKREPPFFSGYNCAMNLRENIAHIIKGDASDELKLRTQYSHDTSIFERLPSVVVFPKDAEDVSAVVKYVSENKSREAGLSISARSAGTDMTGGPLTDSISMVFTKYMNHMGEIGDDYAESEPGVYYRDFEKATLAQRGMIMPSYPASRGLCAVGGMVANNSGGELTLQYGKTNRYVHSLDVVLSDGTQTTFRPLTMRELAAKEAQQDLEGHIYRETHALLEAHAAEIEAARPNVTKNSAGYALWDVFSKKHNTFDLTQLVVGSQGTLAIVTKARLGLVKTKEHRSMLVVFLSDVGILPEIVARVLKFGPESFESYDDQTFKLAVRFIPQIISHFGFIQMIKLGLAFIPEMWLKAYEALQKAEEARDAIEGLAVRTKIARSEAAAAKYWTIRRESFALLRKNLRGLYAAPFIDDIVVHPSDYPRFLPELEALLSGYKLIYTIAGHIGDGNFHIIPLMNLGRAVDHKEILELSPKVYELVAKYHGSITGEHNDGIIRTPYLPLMFGDTICGLFAEVKKIFDPLNILNPGKKIGGTIEDIEKYMIKHG